MDKTIQYRNLIKSLLTKHAELVVNQDNQKMETRIIEGGILFCHYRLIYQ